MPELIERLRALDAKGALTLPAPGSGNTAARHLALLEIGRADLSLARLAEAHVDALAIFEEAERTPAASHLYGVWASDGPASRLELHRLPSGQLLLSGIKKYCTGAGLLDSSLVTAYDGEHRFLVKVPLNAQGITIDSSEWATSAFASTDTATVRFDGVVVESADLIGGPDWYLSRPGFWHGAFGPAACWVGGAVGLIDAARRVNRSDPHSRVHVGALEASEWAMRAVLTEAGRQIDADPDDSAGMGQKRALMARHLIERTCTEVLDRFGRATGPALLAFDAPTAHRYAELTLYIRQCHGERDLAEICKAPKEPG
jgi:alkylation response protein AidB-like acyl-CoA dehydrogenase